MRKAVLFDMDGVLFDSEQAVIDCWDPVAERYGIKDILPKLLACIGITEEASARVFRDAYGEDFPYERYRKEVNERYRKMRAEGRLPMKPGVTEILSWLRERKIPAAVASSGPQKHVAELLAMAGIDGCFQAVIGGDMVKRGKPAPDCFLAAAEALGADPSECIVIEDSYQGVRAGHAAGMTVYMVPDLLPPTEESYQLAKAVLPSLCAVRKEIENGLSS